jgi:hypothetical protein
LSSFFDKLNLKPGERRVVMFVGIGVFILLNAFFVWPHFGDWGKIQKRKRESQALLKAFQDEIANTTRYQKMMSELQEAGAAVSSQEQASKMQTTVQNQAALSGVQVTRYAPGIQTATSSKPNQFFEEQRGTITVTTEEKALIDFLYNLGVGGSLIRVRTMGLSPDPAKQKLMGQLELVASYQKKAPPKATPTVAKPAAASATATPRSAGSTNPAARPNFGAARSNNAAAGRTIPPTNK